MLNESLIRQRLSTLEARELDSMAANANLPRRTQRLVAEELGRRTRPPSSKDAGDAQAASDRPRIFSLGLLLGAAIASMAASSRSIVERIASLWPGSGETIVSLPDAAQRRASEADVFSTIAITSDLLHMAAAVLWILFAVDAISGFVRWWRRP